MAFADSGILDNFNRANNASLGANWTEDVYNGGFNGLNITSNQLDGATGFSDAWWSAASFNAAQEAFATVATIPASGGSIYFACRMSSPGTSSPDHYLLWVERTGTSTWEWRIYRTDDGTDTQLGANGSTQALANGDAVGFRANGDTLSAWYRPSGGSWTLLFTRTDSTYSGGGFIGLGATGNVIRMDDFGGGNVVVNALAGTSAAVAGGTGTLTVGGSGVALAGTSSAVAGGVGDLAVSHPLQGTSNATAGGTGALTGPVALAGVSAAAAGGTGQLAVSHPLGGTSAAVAGGAAYLSSGWAEHVACLRFFGDDTAGDARAKISRAQKDVGSTDFTIEFWCRQNYADNTPTDAQDIRYSAPWVDADQYAFPEGAVFGCARRSGNRLCGGFGVADTGLTWLTEWGSTNIGDGAWHHIRYTWEASTGTMRMYVDGTLEASRSYSVTNLAYPANRTPNGSSVDDRFFVFGTEKHRVGNRFTGRMAHVRISNVRRNTSNFTRPTETFVPDANTVWLLQFNETAGTVARDKSRYQPAVDGSLTLGGPSNGPQWVSSDAPLTIAPTGFSDAVAGGTGVLSAGAMTGTSAAAAGGTGQLTVSHPLGGTSAAAAGGTGALTVSKPLAGLSDAIAGGTGALTVVKPLAGTSAATAGGSTDLLVAHPLGGVSAGAAGGSGDLVVSHPLAGISAAVANGTGALSTGAMSGTSAAAAGGSGQLTVSKPLAGAADATCGGVGALSVAKPLSGVSAAIAAGTVELLVAHLLAGASAGIAGGSGDLTVSHPLQGTSNATAAGSGVLNVGELTGVSVAMAGGTGQLTVAHLLAGTSAAVAGGLGALAGPVELQGVSVATAGGSGVLLVVKALGGVSACEGAASGNLTVGLSLTGISATVAGGSGELTVVKLLVGTSRAEVTILAMLTVAKLLAGVSGATAGGRGSIAPPGIVGVQATVTVIRYGARVEQ